MQCLHDISVLYDASVYINIRIKLNEAMPLLLGASALKNIKHLYTDTRNAIIDIIFGWILCLRMAYHASQTMPTWKHYHLIDFPFQVENNGLLEVYGQADIKSVLFLNAFLRNKMW